MTFLTFSKMNKKQLFSFSEHTLKYLPADFAHPAISNRSCYLPGQMYPWIIHQTTTTHFLLTILPARHNDIRHF